MLGDRRATIIPRKRGPICLVVPTHFGTGFWKGKYCLVRVLRNFMSTIINVFRNSNLSALG